MSKLQDQLRRDEGDKESVYQDQLGFATIGIGFMIDARKGGKLPPAVRDFWFDHIIGEREEALRKAFPWFERLDEARQGALLNMSYQLGVAGLLAFNATLASIRDERYADAAQHMLESLWARQTPARARRLARQIETGEWQ